MPELSDFLEGHVRNTAPGIVLGVHAYKDLMHVVCTGSAMQMLPPQPPEDDKDPQYKEQEPHEPAPVSSLPFRHLVHPSERAAEKVGR